jgi:hypothetical protein
LASDHPASHMMNTETSEKCNRFQASWWNSAVWKSFAVRLDRDVCQLSKYTENRNSKFDFPCRTYNRNTSTLLPLQYGQSWFIDGWTSQFGHLWHC